MNMLPVHSCQVVLCGRGGQGVLFLTRLIDETVLAAGGNVISSETHGMAMRGGSVASYVRIGAFRSPLIRAGQADAILALSEPELEMNRYLLHADSGRVLVNRATGSVDCVDASCIARQLGIPMAANLVLLGAACVRELLPCTLEQIKAVAVAISPERFQRQNIDALDAGAQACAA